MFGRSGFFIRQREESRTRMNAVARAEGHDLSETASDHRVPLDTIVASSPENTTSDSEVVYLEFTKL
jgi:hypothetical protein